MARKGRSKIKVANKKSRFGRVLSYGALCSGLLFVCIFTLKVMPADILLIKSIQIIGNLQRVEPSNLQHAVAGISKMGFFSTDVKLLKGIIENIPWVSSVSVRRIWPDKLQLNIKEQIAIARWNEDRLLNSDGHLFFPGIDNIPENIPYLSGPEGKQETLLVQYNELESILADSELKIKKLIINNRRAMQLELENGVRILFGQVNDISNDISDAQAALTRFVRAYHGGLSKRINDVDSIDMRYTNGFSVRWKDSVQS